MYVCMYVDTRHVCVCARRRKSTGAHTGRVKQKPTPGEYYRRERIIIIIISGRL